MALFATQILINRKGRMLGNDYYTGSKVVNKNQWIFIVALNIINILYCDWYFYNLFHNTTSITKNKARCPVIYVKWIIKWPIFRFVQKLKVLFKFPIWGFDSKLCYLEYFVNFIVWGLFIYLNKWNIQQCGQLVSINQHIKHIV